MDRNNQSDHIIHKRLMNHSSQIEGLCLMKRTSQTLQNLPYFVHTKKNKVHFFALHLVLPTLFFP